MPYTDTKYPRKTNGNAMDKKTIPRSCLGAVELPIVILLSNDRNDSPSKIAPVHEMLGDRRA